MSLSDARARRRGLPSASLGLLLILVSLTTIVDGVQAGHVHRDSTPGLYSTDCPLAALAAFHGASPLPGSPASVETALVNGSPLTRRDELSAPPPAHCADCRAPPTA